MTTVRLDGDGAALVDRDDVTELKRRLREAEKEIARLEHGMRVRDAVLARVSHELRTPLNAILGWASCLVKDDVNEATRRRASAIIQRNAQAEASLIEELVDMSQVVRGTIPMRREDIDLTALAADVLDGLQPAATARSVALHLEREVEHAPVAGDARLLKKAIIELVKNSIQHSKAGARVQVAVGADVVRVKLTVRDDGDGISAGFLPDVFEAFAQEHPEATARTGLGLGLTLARHIAELHGGSITAASAGTGQGATFVLVLPARA